MQLQKKIEREKIRSSFFVLLKHLHWFQSTEFSSTDFQRKKKLSSFIRNFREQINFSWKLSFNKSCCQLCEFFSLSLFISHFALYFAMCSVFCWAFQLLESPLSINLVSHFVICMHCFSTLSWHFSTFKVQLDNVRSVSSVFCTYIFAVGCILSHGNFLHYLLSMLMNEKHRNDEHWEHIDS